MNRRLSKPNENTKHDPVKCLICNKEFYNGNYLSSHLKFEEHITGQEYYDTYLKKEHESICIVCGKPTNYINFTRGYQKTCSQMCNNSSLSDKGKLVSKVKQTYTEEKRLSIREKREQTCISKYGYTTNFKYKPNNGLSAIEASHTTEARLKAKNTHKKHMLDGTITGQNVKQSWKTRKNKIEQYCIQNNCTPVIQLLGKYGQGWLSLDIPRIYLNKQNSVISNEYLSNIDDYFNLNQYSNKSKAEQYIIDNLNYDGKIIHNDRSVLRPKELDIYIPDLKLAIEYNGIYWHSIEFCSENKYYHRYKSIACKALGIRLIHIFEFENLNEQIYLLNQLILGNDLFEPIFTKNSLLDIPIDDPIILYKDDKNTIYSA